MMLSWLIHAAFRTVAILTATVPDRFAFHRKHNALMDIEVTSHHNR